MAKIELKRIKKLDDRTIGSMIVNRSHSFATLELPWKNNEKNISCIPCGKYKLAKRWSKKYGNHLKVENVPNRSDILIHVGNYPQDTQGCILIGADLRDINADGELEVVNSKFAMDGLLSLLKDDGDISLEIFD